MARVSNGIITGVNILTLLLAISTIGYSVWLHVKSQTPCERVLQTPLLVVGAAVLVVSVAGMVGSTCRVSVVMWLYLFVLFLLILGLIVFTVFAIIVTNKGVGKAMSGKGVGDHRLGDYNGWLQKYVVNAENWDEIKSCMVGVKLCQRIEGGRNEDYYKYNLSPITSSCCKPPNYCGFEFQNATYWTMPKAGPATPHPDCQKWSNVQRELCFDCDSCKVSFLDNIKRQWRILAIFNVCVLVFVVIVYSVGCCALRNNRYSGYGKHRQGHP